MEIIVSEEDKKKKNIVYLATIYGKYGKKHHYIGETTRELQKRIYEHINGKSAIHNFIRDNYVDYITFEIINQCEYQQLLDISETIAICKYFCERGTTNNQRNRLINRDLKGLNKLPLKEIKNFSKCVINY